MSEARGEIDGTAAAGFSTDEPRTAPLGSAARALIVEADDDTREHLAKLARESYVRVTAVATVAEAVDAAKRERFDMAIVEIPAGQPQAAFAAARALRSSPGNERLPLAYTAVDASFDQRVAAAHAGGSLFLSKPIDPYVFGATVQRLAALGHAERSRVLVIDDDADFLEAIAAVLEAEGIAVTGVSTPDRIIDSLEVEKPDLILLDVMLPGVSGFDLARMIRSAPEWQSVPILFLTGRADVESRVAAFDAGGDDYIAKPVLPEELLARVRVRLERRRLEREITEKDALTKLLSRRVLLESLARRLSEARRHGTPLSVALIDVDRFKLVNDEHGHLAGDQVLAALGRLLNERFRLEDLRGRWGGEEFVIVFPGVVAETASGVLRRVLAELARLRFRGERGSVFHVTFSGGVSSAPDDGSSVDALLKAADKRLYAAKASGRSRVVGPIAGASQPDSSESDPDDMDRDVPPLRH